MLRLILALFVLILPLNPAAAQQSAEPVDPDAAVLVRTAWSHSAAQPGSPIMLAVVLDIAEPFHVNAHEPGDDDLIATMVELNGLPAGTRIDPARYPPGKPLRFAYADQPIRVYSGQTIIHVPVQVGSVVAPGEYDISMALTWQACDDAQCYMPQQVNQPLVLRVAETGAAVAASDEPELFMTVAPAGPQTDADETAAGATDESAQAAMDGPRPVQFDFLGRHFELPAGSIFTTIAILAMALLAGVLLNFTPCVLPVVPLKVLSLQQHAGSRSRALALSISFSLGIVACFALLGLLAFGLISGVHQMQWGELFSYWWFASLVGLIVGVMGLGMFGLFTTSLPQWVYQVNPRQDTHLGSFLFGILTAVLSTPCTAPLFPGALGWAITQPAYIGLGVFLAAGIGMAIPYQLLMINPKWIDRLPRSGPGGELIKQVMGLLLLAVAAYFFGLAGRGAGLWGNGYWWAVQNLIIVAMAWMLLRTWQLTDRAGLRATAGIIAVVGIAFGWSLALNFATPAHDAQQFAMNVGATDNPGNPGNPGPRLWQSYSPERFQAARDAGHTVVVEFTADWCANCKVIEATVLKDQQVIDRLSGDGIVTLKVDLTSRSNAIGWDKLRSLGSRGIPLTAIYHPGREQPVMLTSIYTSAALLDALDEG